MESLNNSYKLYSWGIGNAGQLGVPIKNQKKVRQSYNMMLPTVVSKAKNPLQVSVYNIYTMYIDKNGDVYAMGNNSKGKMGLGTSTDVEFPMQVPNLKSIVKIEAGYWHSLALDSNGLAWSAGNNSKGELGRSDGENSFNQVESSLQFRDISAGFGVSFFIETSGVAHSCGKAILNGHDKNQASLKEVKSLEGEVLQIDCGLNYICAITS